MCKTSQEDQNRGRGAEDNQPRLLRSAKLHRVIHLKESAVQIYLARKQNTNKKSGRPVLGVGSRSSGQENGAKKHNGPRKVTVGNSDIANFETRDQRKTKLYKYIDRRGPPLSEKPMEFKIASNN